MLTVGVLLAELESGVSARVAALSVITRARRSRYPHRQTRCPCGGSAPCCCVRGKGPRPVWVRGPFEKVLKTFRERRKEAVKPDGPEKTI
jgi:hypothetical protein